jgi:hypothetical protein
VAEPRDKLHNIHGRLFQAAMWREYAMTWKGRPTRTGVDQRWCEQIGGMTYIGCLRRARVNLYLARRLNRRRRLDLSASPSGVPRFSRRTADKASQTMTDDQIEEMVRDLIKNNPFLDEDTRQAALEWLDKRIIAYQAMVELGWDKG